jgi:hypothetical protein
VTWTFSCDSILHDTALYDDDVLSHRTISLGERGQPDLRINVSDDPRWNLNLHLEGSFSSIATGNFKVR